MRICQRAAMPAILNLEWYSTPTEWPIHASSDKCCYYTGARENTHLLCVIGREPFTRKNLWNIAYVTMQPIGKRAGEARALNCRQNHIAYEINQLFRGAPGRIALHPRFVRLFAFRYKMAAAVGFDVTLTGVRAVIAWFVFNGSLLWGVINSFLDRYVSLCTYILEHDPIRTTKSLCFICFIVL